VEELHYHPSHFARSLRVKKTYTICNVLLKNPTSFYLPFLRGVHTVAEKAGYFTIFITLPAPPEEIHSFQQIIGLDYSDGVILWAGNAKIVEKFIPLSKLSRIPTVSIGSVLEGTNIPSVTLDNVRGGYLATKYLGDLGHKRIGFIGRPERNDFNERLIGYQKALKELGLPDEESLIALGLGDLDTGFEAMNRLLAIPEPPTAVFSTNDDMAVGAVKAILKKGMRVPDDISIVGYDDAPPSLYSIPPLTTIRHHMELMGRVAAELLIRLLQSDTDHRQGEGERIVIEPELVIRESCRAIGPS
jgi:DNA-binding LacI/PurR family transcriptional regulator